MKKIVTNCYESFTDSCEQFMDNYVLLWAAYDRLRMVTSYLRQNKSVDNRKKIFYMSKNLPPLSRILTSVYELLQIVMSYLPIPASYLRMLAIDYELAIRKDS